MRWKSHFFYYQPRNCLELPCISDDSERDWWTAKDIQREYIRKYRRFITLAKIGREAKKLGKVRNTTYGFKLYHSSLVDDLN